MSDIKDDQREAEPFGGREGRIVPGETVKLTPEEVAARKRRNIAIGLSLLAFCALVFVVTVIKIGQNFSEAGAI